jgi:aspartate aminotransferase
LNHDSGRGSSPVFPCPADAAGHGAVRERIGWSSFLEGLLEIVAKREVDLQSYFLEESADLDRRCISTVAQGLVGSEILKIAGEIRALSAAGETICNLTVGDFAPTEFRIPARLESLIADSLAAGETNYPPSDGILELRKEVISFYERELGLRFPLESVLIAGGARPIIYATYRAILDPGEKVLYTIPSWNNNHYAFLSGASAVELPVSEETNFLPTANLIRPLLDGVRLICINTPLNPTGTVLSRLEVKAIASLVVEENARRARTGDRALYLMWDQVYWMLTFGSVRHWMPQQLVPESSAWTVVVDGISKAFAATGLRVGWAAGPPHVIRRMRDILGHVGAWAPRPEQVATARLLKEKATIDAYHTAMLSGVQRRLEGLHRGFQSMKESGLAVDSVPPQGAIYLSVRFNLVGKVLDGQRIETNEGIRKLLLREAGFAVVPFQAFGAREENGWMRLSVGAVSPEEIAAGIQRVRALLERMI